MLYVYVPFLKLKMTVSQSIPSVVDGRRGSRAVEVDGLEQRLADDRFAPSESQRCSVSVKAPGCFVVGL